MGLINKYMKIENYGELLAKGLEMKLLFYEEYGSYSGDYIAILESDDTVEIYKGNYGSCSGCDWLEAERDWETNSVSDEKIKEYCSDEKPFLSVDKSKLDTLINSEDMSVYFPANTRNDYDDWNFDDIKKALIEIKSQL
jgi:hypothetical protein